VSVTNIPLVTVQGEVDVRPALPAPGDYLPVRLTDGSNWSTASGGGDVNLIQVGGTAVSLGQKAMAASLPVVLASNQSAVPVSGSVTVTSGAVTVSGTVTANAGTGTFTVGDGGLSLTVDSAQLPAALGQATMAASLSVVLASNQSALPVSGTVTANQGGAWTVTANAGTGTFTVGGTVAVSSVSGTVAISAAQLPATLGQKTAALSLAVVLASDQPALPTQPAGAATATTSNVAASATSVQLLAANAARKGATCYNDSAADCYLKLGTTASATSFTVKLGPFAYYEIPFGYTGRVDGVWSSAAGAARVTELS
jgi:hypothetical protein